MGNSCRKIKYILCCISGVDNQIEKIKDEKKDVVDIRKEIEKNETAILNIDKALNELNISLEKQISEVKSKKNIENIKNNIYKDSKKIYNKVKSEYLDAKNNFNNSLKNQKGIESQITELCDSRTQYSKNLNNLGVGLKKEIKEYNDAITYAQTYSKKLKEDIKDLNLNKNRQVIEIKKQTDDLVSNTSKKEFDEIENRMETIKETVEDIEDKKQEYECLEDILNNNKKI